MLKKENKILIASFLILGLGIFSFNASPTNAFYNDTESSSENTFQAAMLDFILTNNNLNKIIGLEALGEISHASVAMPESGSLAMQYVLNTSIATTTSNADFCNELIVEAKDNGITKYSGPLSGLWSATTTDFGTWEFRFDLPPNVSVPHGAQCNANALFSAWRADVVDPANSGWHDEETLNISFAARMVVLNEIYANPYVAATPPKNREYVELYNNGSTDVDVLGWKIAELTGGGAEVKHLIVASGATASQMQPFNTGTIIPAGGFLILVFGTEGASYFNNTGDMVKLYDNATTLLDFHAYPSVAAGKSVVRFPDGIGYWVDPEATPGTTNVVSIEDLRAAGFDDAMIAQVLELALIKNASILEKAVAMTLSDEPNISTTTPEIIATSTADTTTITFPPFKEEEIVAAENASTTPEIITEVAPSTQEITPPDPLLQQEGGSEVISEAPSPSQGEGVGDEVVSEPVTESLPVVEPEPAETPPPVEPAPVTPIE